MTIHNVDKQLDINTLPNCVTNHEKRRATHAVEKETPVSDHTLSDHVINRGKQSVARSRETNNFANNLDQQKTRNVVISAGIRQTLANDSNIYLGEQVKKHCHRNGKLEFLIKWLGYLNHQNTWKPEDYLPPVLVQKYFQQSLLEKPTNAPTNAVLLTSDIYRLCQLFLNKNVCWMTIFTLITVIILTAVASHTHCHFKPPFGKQDKSFVSPECNLTWKELLACSTSIRFTVRLQLVESKKNSRLCLLDWALPPVLAEKLHLMDHLVLGAYNPLHPRNTSLIHTVIHARCHVVMKVKEHPLFSLKRPLKHSMSASQFPILSHSFLYLPLLHQLNHGSICTLPMSFIFVFTRIYIYIYIYIYMYICIYVYIYIIFCK